MRRSVLIVLAGAAALSAGAAFAQAPADTAVNPPAASASADTSYASSDTLGDVTKLKAGDPNVVSNNPVPDTPQNRQAFGGPRSNGGRATAPKGD